MFRQIALSVSVVLSVSLVACGGGGAGMSSSLPASSQNNSGSTTSKTTTQSATMTYVAPYGGPGGGSSIYLLAANGCGDISVTPANSSAFPANVANGTLAQGTMVTVVGNATNSSGAAITTGCPTGGIVATSVTAANATKASPGPSGAPTAGPTAVPTASSTQMTYVAPYGGTGAAGAIFLLAANGCGDIPVTAASSAAFPANVANGTLASGTSVTVIGTAKNSSGAVITTGCPTGGIVATSVALTGAAPAPTAAPVAAPIAAPIASPVPTATPKASPTAAPTTAPVSGSFASLTDAASIGNSPLLSASSSSWYHTIPGSPAQASNSSAMISQQISSIGCSTGCVAAGVSATMPYYIGRSTDPIVTIGNGHTLHIPANSEPEQFPNCSGGNDCHTIVLDQTSTNSFGKPMECDFYQDNNARPLKSGQTFNSAGAACYDPAAGSGWSGGSGGGIAVAGYGVAVAGGAAILPSIVTVAQVQAAISGGVASSLMHATQIAPACNGGTNAAQFPASAGAAQGCNNGSTANQLPMGALIWSDVPCSTVNANPLTGTSVTLDLYSKVLLCTLNVHGAYVADTNANQWAFNLQTATEDPQQYTALGETNVAANYYATSVMTGGRPNLNGIPASFWEAHLHVLAAGCLQAGSC
jgi:hypothetical protein